MRLNSIVPVSAIIDSAGGVDGGPLINVTSPVSARCGPMGGGIKRDNRTGKEAAGVLMGVKYTSCTSGSGREGVPFVTSSAD